MEVGREKWSLACDRVPVAVRRFSFEIKIQPGSGSLTSYLLRAIGSEGAALGQHAIAIGYDGRLSGPELAAALHVIARLPGRAGAGISIAVVAKP